MKKEALKRMIVTAVFSAIAYLFTFLVKFKVSFLTFDFKDAVIAVVALVIGPVYGFICAVLAAFFEFISISDTGVYGLIMNIISSGSFALIIGLVYKYNRTFSGAVISAVTAALGVTAVMMLANLFITPLYMGVPKGTVAKMIPTLLLPFNLAKTAINGATTMMIYKPITSALRRVGLVKKSESKATFGTKTVILYLVSGAIIVLSVLFIIFIMRGGITTFLS